MILHQWSLLLGDCWNGFLVQNHAQALMHSLLLLAVHDKLGFAVAGVYDHQMAEQKIYEVLITAKENEFPLQVTGEAE